ncbi:MAG TPA: hypothetical protein VIL97_04210, partial [Thermoanaerobaculia bacterium]
MKKRPFVLALAIGFVVASATHAKDIYLTIAGSVGVFRTDTRILNPSFDKDITIIATFIPAGN